MKRTPLKRKTALKAHKRLYTYSFNKIAQLNSEVESRIALCQRCGGIPQIDTREVKHKGGISTLATVTCIGGYCEICGKTGMQLFPHEKVFRSHGGKLSLENSIMACNPCHDIAQNNLPKWT